MKRSTTANVDGQPTSLLALSPRECEVLALLLEANSNKEIAVRLNIAEVTVREYVCRIMAAIDAPNRVALCLWVLTYPQVMHGHSVPLVLHQVGCPCERDICRCRRAA